MIGAGAVLLADRWLVAGADSLREKSTTGWLAGKSCFEKYLAIGAGAVLLADRWLVAGADSL